MQCLQNLAKSGERSVLTLGSLCLPCCARYSVKLIYYYFYLHYLTQVKQLHIQYVTIQGKDIFIKKIVTLVMACIKEIKRFYISFFTVRCNTTRYYINICFVCLLTFSKVQCKKIHIGLPHLNCYNLIKTKIQISIKMDNIQTQFIIKICIIVCIEYCIVCIEASRGARAQSVTG